MNTDTPCQTKRLLRMGRALVLAAGLWSLPSAAAAQTNLSLTFDSPATNAAAGAVFDGGFQFAPTNMLVTATITAGAAIVPQDHVELTYPDATNGVVALTPRNNRSGLVSVRVRGVTGAVTNEVNFDVWFRRYPPVLTLPASVTMDEDETRIVDFTVHYPDRAVDDDALTWSVTSTNTALIDAGTMDFGGSGTNRTLTLRPKADINGAARITVTVQDDDYTVNRSMMLTVDPVPDRPTLDGVVDADFGDDVGTTNVFAGSTAGDVDHRMPAPELLTVTATLDSDVYATFSNSLTTVVMSGTPSNVTAALRSLAVYPKPYTGVPGTYHDVNATVRVEDSSSWVPPVESSVRLRITVINTQPNFAVRLDPDSVTEGELVQPFHIDHINDPDIGEHTFTLHILFDDPAQTALGAMVPVAALTNNVSGLYSDIRNIGFQAGSEVMDQDSTNIVFRFELTDTFGKTDTNYVEMTLRQIRRPPSISGIPSQIMDVNDGAAPFAIYPEALVQDPDVGSGGGPQPVRAVLSQSDSSLGSFSQTNFVFQYPSSLTEALRQATYRPTPGALPVGAVAETLLTLTVTDETGLAATNSLLRLRITSVNNPPRILNVPEEQPMRIPPTVPLRPFVALGLENDDEHDIEFTLTIDDPDKGALSNLGGFVQTTADQYHMEGTVSNVLHALTNIVYTLDEAYPFAPDDPGGTLFTLRASDYALLADLRILAIQVQDEPRHHLVTRTLNDGQPGSFTYALAQAGNNDVITFALPSYPAVVRMPGTAADTLVRNLNIRGPGADLLTLSGDHNGDGQPDRRILNVAARVSVEGVTFSHGVASMGGALRVQEGGELILRHCAVVHSVAAQYGGAIDVDGGGLTLEGCFIGWNRLAADTGMSGAGVSIYSDRSALIRNTTFYGNAQANEDGDGGAALVMQNRTPGALADAHVVHCTFAENTDAAQRASSALSVDFGARIRPANSIFADGSGRGLNVAAAGEFLSSGGNIADDSTRVPLTQQGQGQEATLLDHGLDAVDTDARLAPLNLTGDPTPYCEPLSGSPAIDREGAVSGLSADQRGVIRSQTPDSGAVEFEARRRALVNEISFDDAHVHYVEIAVRRDSAPVDLAGYSLFLDGVAIHDFSNGRIVGTNDIFAADASAPTRIDPGFGMVIAFTNEPFRLLPDGQSTPVVRPSRDGAPSGLPQRGRLAIGVDADREPFMQIDWLGSYLDPVTGTNELAMAGNAIALAPQFRGSAFVPHGYILAGPYDGADFTRDPASAPRSPGADVTGTPFGASNAYPLALPDLFTVTEEDRSVLDVLANDFDGDGNDRLVVADVSMESEAGASGRFLTHSALGAAVSVIPADTPLRGASVVYDPRNAPLLHALPVGVEAVDTFYYKIVDIGSAAVEGYAATNGQTAVRSVGHRLTNGEQVTIAGAGQSVYNGTFAVTVLDPDTFSIPVSHAPSVAPLGQWQTVLPRAPTAFSEASVSVRVAGVNDAPVAVPDLVSNVTELSVTRIMAHPEWAGSDLVFPEDPDPAPSMSAQNLLGNDFDPDSDDGRTDLRLVGIVGTVQTIADYTGTNGASPVVVHSTGHGLETGAEVLVANYGGHASYNGYHTAVVLDADRFAIPVPYVDNHAAKGVWTLLDDARRYDAVSPVGATVRMTLRANPFEDHVVYDASASAYLKGLAEDEIFIDSFWYAVADRHGAIGMAPAQVRVIGINDRPVTHPDAHSLAELAPLVSEGRSLADILHDGLELLYTLPATDGGAARCDAHVLDRSATLPGIVVLHDFFTTDEDSPLALDTAWLLANDEDVDRIDLLRVVATDPFSREAATLTLQDDVLTYHPQGSSNLQALARSEMRIDTFSIVVSDGMTDGVATSLVAVLVVGVNDTPQARAVVRNTHEDEILVFDPRLNDIEIDIDGTAPDDRLRVVAVSNLANTAGARIDLTTTNVTHDATVSSLLDQLADWQSYTNVFAYTVTDNSFLMAMDDEFRVPAGTAERLIDVLANDRDFTDSPGRLTVLEAGPTLHGGTVTVVSNGLYLAYSAPADFAGDDSFRYIVGNDEGDAAYARVTVRSVVAERNGLLHAADDVFAVAYGETLVMPVLANDGMAPADSGEWTINGPFDSSVPGQPTIAGRTFVFTATNGLAPLTFSYEVSAGGTATGRAAVAAHIVDRRATLAIQDDSFSVSADSLDNELDVLDNDGLVGAPTDDWRIQEIVAPPGHGTVEIGEDDTRLVYTPSAGFIGVDRLGYRVTDGLGGTGTGTVSVAVGRIEAVADFFKAEAAHALPVELDVLANDRMLPAPRGSLTLLSVEPIAPTAIGTLAPHATGDRLLFTAAGVTGQAQFRYVVADASTPALTATGQVDIVTVAPGTYANPDRYRVRGDSGEVELDVLINDRGYPAQGRVYSLVALGEGAQGPGAGGTVRIADNKLYYTPAPGFFGEEQFSYTMSDSVATDTAQVTVSVRRGDLVANDDRYAVFYEWDADADAPRDFRLPVTFNDRVQPALDQTLSVVALGAGPHAPDQGGRVQMAADAQALVYRPAADPVSDYVETFTYEISDGLARRAAATVRVRVMRRDGALESVTLDDAYTVERNSRSNTLDVLANDSVRPATAAAWTIETVTPSLHGATIEIVGAALRYAPPADFVGVDRFAYSVSDGLGGSGSAQVEIRVGALPVTPDRFVALAGSSSNVFDVIANDIHRSDYAEEYVLNAVFGAGRGGAVAVGPSNRVVYAPDPGYAGLYPYTEEFFYTVLDESAVASTGTVAVLVQDAASGRDSAAITLVVAGRNDAPYIENPAPNTPITDKDTAQPFAEVVLVEIDQQLQEAVEVRVAIDDPAKGRLTALGAFSDLGGGVYGLSNVTAAAATLAVRSLVYEPVENRITVPETETVVFTISVTDHKSPWVEDTQTALAVTAVNDPPTVAGMQAGQRFFYKLPVRPFGQALLGDVDDLTLQPLVVTLTVLDADHGEIRPLGDFAFVSNGVYRATNITAAAATAQLRDVRFYHAADVPVPAGGTVTTRFRLDVDDGFAPPVSDALTSVVACHAFEGGLRPGDEAQQGEFGLAVATLADFAVVGAPGASVQGVNAGCAFVYKCEAGGTNEWAQWRVLLPAAVAAGDRFGQSVAISDELIAVGAPEQTVGGHSTGAVYLYLRDAGGEDQWGQAIRLTPNAVTNSARFGWSIALCGDWLAVGAPDADLDGDGTPTGAVFLFGRHQGGLNAWGEIRRWELDGAEAADSDFGWSVALLGDTLMVGAPKYNAAPGTEKEGAVFHFARHAGGANAWGLVETLVSDEPSLSRNFGWSVALSEGRLAIGAPSMRAGSVDAAGRVYLFDQTVAGQPWTAASVPQIDRRSDAVLWFGYSLALDGDLLLVGAPMNTGVENIGAAYLYRTGDPVSPGWQWVETRTRPVGSAANLFGRAVALHEGSGLVGAPATKVGASPNSRGHVFFYRFDYSEIDADDPPLSVRERWDRLYFGAATRDPLLEPTLWGGDSDADGDGVSNDREYAFGGDPETADSAGKLSIAIADNGMLIVEYQRRSDDPALVFSLLGSENLVDWMVLDTIIVSLETIPLDDRVEAVTMVIDPPTGQGALMLRVLASW